MSLSQYFLIYILKMTIFFFLSRKCDNVIVGSELDITEESQTSN